MTVYELIVEHLTHLSGPKESLGLFDSRSKAETAAEKDFGSPLKWKAAENGIHTDDLGHVMYHIKMRAVS